MRTGREEGHISGGLVRQGVRLGVIWRTTTGHPDTLNREVT